MPESITDIARALKVAPSTVSRALSAPEKVSPKTRQKILEYTRKVGYHPNISARNLRKQQSRTIGIVVNDLCDILIAQAANIMQDTAYKRGYFPVLLSTDESPVKERESFERLLVLNACGVVIIPSSATASLLPAINNIPVVELDRSTSTNINDEFRMDDTAAMQMATSYLRDQGCRHLAVVFGNIDRISSFKSRHLALTQCAYDDIEYSSFFIKDVNADGLINDARRLTSSLINTCTGVIRSKDSSSAAQSNGKGTSASASASADAAAPAAGGRKGSGKSRKSKTTASLADDCSDILLPTSATPESCRASQPIDGFIAANHSIAAGILQACYDQGIEINKDLRIFTFDNPAWLSILPYQVASITHPLVKAAELAINRLIDRVEGKYTETAEARLLRPALNATNR
ncbi:MULTISPECIES: LacI family DNA-binding transcriptional regulator [unclassified Anaerobiospirillum]|uniref:LacI family DNA-binding transcriptional regulator n=1 Tax=unclassified Anaerobiospirillum TaxID=2647410 RepID=UPI001FF54DCE|nr:MULTISPECIES: LacI family DNA-binding transcriptional regulator [unclassified Anaerobiospirillum]MCK0535495.1 LacI family transcriptional regulator [Anaerobiospirillum sp. NML120511]MCK0540691.1 LacI family transcriptional regulator [Anaerobiospirillum sp. NML02-A-032]